MKPSLDREGERRYATAFYHSVVFEGLRFTEAEAFATWWARSGHLFYASVEDANAAWAARGMPPGPEVNQP